MQKISIRNEASIPSLNVDGTMMYSPRFIVTDGVTTPEIASEYGPDVMMCAGIGELSGLWGNTVTFNAGAMDGRERWSASCKRILRAKPHCQCLGRSG